MKNNIKVIVADDMKIITENMQSIIAGNPRVDKVVTAFDGEEALIKIMNLEPDIIFTDMQMPKRTGLELIECIKSYPCIRKKPQIVLVTSDRDSELILKSRELGFSLEYKPISPEKINEYLNSYTPIEEDKEVKEKRLKEEKIKLDNARKEIKKEGLLRRLLKK